MSNDTVLILFPIAVGIVMLGLGLTLTLDDFRRVVRYPKAMVVCLVSQMLILPAICLGLVVAFDLRPELAVGMMLLAASPGGSTASLYSHLFKGDLALNISLTAVNSVLALFTLPIIVNLSVAGFVGSDSSIGLQFDKVIQVFALVLIPIAIGMAIRARFTDAALRLERAVKVLSVVVLILMISSVIAGLGSEVFDILGEIILAVVAFNLISMGLGYFGPRLLRVGERESIASAFEIGLHNASLAITIGMSPTLLDNSTMAMPSVTYGFVMFFTAAVFGVVVSRRVRAGTATGDFSAAPSRV
ncbi:bile acid:Na+ symporter, BASS family [Micromonospora haikouensis]|uniref:Bile acid:Na+ symporter, BASS family n=2 Tax=Micromonospora haikouensis TaxID=686309 RepID=A0A1C4Y775_9ACTN|nr:MULTISPECIES: bile acid:sodium symporter family protein [Micromonospora]OON27404.1 bile acid:sodium symporter [Micromonospora sp. Rc5]SCF16575.1 bile acid:Na+ symporter, BASS family [Micromonospora haikouensis]